MPIFRAKMKATRKDRFFKKGQIVGYKIFDAKNLAEANKKKKTLVGFGRKVISITPTRLKGKVKSRYKLPRSKRYGRGYD